MEEKILDVISDSTHYNEQLFTTMQERIDRIKNDGIPLIAEEDINDWILFDERFSQNYFINFNIDNFNSNREKKNKYILLAKSWFIFMIENNVSFKSVARKTRKIIQAFELSNGFDSLKFDVFANTYFPEHYSLNSLQASAAHILEFLDFTENITLSDEYYELILKYYYIKKEELIRLLPPSRDVLKFSLVVENYFEKEKDDTGYWNYYPIHLWWEITNIIPIRISEFCNLSHDCLIKSDEGYFLTLPRSKYRGSQKTAYDKILISDKVAHLILAFRENVTLTRTSRTLLQTDNTIQNYRPEVFNQRNFLSLLNNFYRHIVSEKYKFNVTEDGIMTFKDSPYNISRKVRPNDTRHFAFLNLMLQGYHPSEIARLGGHNSIYSQMPYHRHIEYWVDSDLINLLMNQKNYFSDLSNEFYKELLFKNAIHSTQLTAESIHIPLDIGYCTDPLQDCPVDEHYLCPHWRLTYEDYLQHSEQIHQSIKKQESALKLCIDKLLSLHKSGLIYNKNNLYSESNSEFNYQLLESSKVLKSALYQLVKLKERVEIYEK